MFYSLKVLYGMNYLSMSIRVTGSEIRGRSLILDENGNVSRTCQLSAGGTQDLDLHSKFEPSTRDEADGHLQLPCFTAIDFPERNSLQDTLVDHMLFGFQEHTRREDEIGRCSDRHRLDVMKSAECWSELTGNVSDPHSKE